MKEWMSPWNPFNSAKVLLWKEHLQACADEDYLPPVHVSIDPSNRCNFNCGHCNAYRMIHDSGVDMPEEHMVKLVDFLAYWRDSTRHGVPNAACVSGGGEPYMNKNINALFERMHHHGMEIGIITNGFLLTDEDIDVVAKTARWIGFSVDAADPYTHSTVKGINTKGAFGRVVENLEKLVVRTRESWSNCDVAFKFLLTPDNAREIYDAIKLAKSIGVKDFHLRPAGWDNLEHVERIPNYERVADEINRQIAEGMKLETKDFRVFGIRHKFNPDFSRKVPFSRCWAVPMSPTFGADGNVHTCCDRRGDKDLILCRHTPNPYEVLKHWNTAYHREMLRKIDPVKDCPRCTYGSYNEIVEKVIIDDSMCMYFL